ncbi:hypothetical protein PCASD_01355 [Puccinia coronata f. sp. avenae]|uniref:Carboxypeptidase n=1 Tax=Puccinia coronata f. sp. avenae TaxID=200324 RepID=A0A2N5VJ34_9BASI|nr:hypothetical protein PCASD_01355 [Puccinia coronata f. sp. avenae]
MNLLLLARCTILWNAFEYSIQADSSQQHHSAASGPSSPLQFSSPQAKRFSVPRKLPQMDFEIGPSYAGLIDISKGPHDQAKMFFWFIPAETALGANELTLWSNGGPGCSSMIGAFQENGPIMWDAGRIQAIKNPLSWHTRSSMLYIDHPVGVGYSVGNVVIENETQVADYLCRFLEAWLKVFPEMSSKNFYLAGESYAGMYLSYTAATIHANKFQLPLTLKGLLLIDAVFSDTLLQEQVPLYTFVAKHKDIFKFDASFMAKLNATDKRCGYSEYLHENLVYPSRGFLPELTQATSSKNPKQVKPQCNIVTMMNLKLPPAFQTYNIMWKKAYDYALDPFFTYFDLAEVKEAFNINGKRRWRACQENSDQSIFPNGDQSSPPALTVLPDVIQKNNRTVLVQGGLDAIIFTDGTKLALQNLTWNEVLGFKNPIVQPFSVHGQVVGRFNSERGLTYIEIDDSGHKLPHDKPAVALQILDFFLGHQASLSPAN